MSRSGPLFAVCLAVLLASCTQETPPPSLPIGVQEVTGVLMPVEISIHRRGTHVLRAEGVDATYVESSAVNLRRYEQRDVVLEGVYEHNIDPAMLPVFVVQRIVEVVEETYRTWDLRSLQLTLEAPEEWKGLVKEALLELRVPEQGQPLVVVTHDETVTELPRGEPIVVGGQRAVRTINETTGAHSVTLEREGAFLVLHFTPADTVRSERWREEWLKLLRSITFDQSQSSDGPVTGTGAGRPCGGPAGILCPENFYCDVTHLEENIGVCRRI